MYKLPEQQAKLLALAQQQAQQQQDITKILMDIVRVAQHDRPEGLQVRSAHFASALAAAAGHYQDLLGHRARRAA